MLPAISQSINNQITVTKCLISCNNMQCISLEQKYVWSCIGFLACLSFLFLRNEYSRVSSNWTCEVMFFAENLEFGRMILKPYFHLGWCQIEARTALWVYLFWKIFCTYSERTKLFSSLQLIPIFTIVRILTPDDY